MSFRTEMEAPKVVHKERPIPVRVEEEYGEGERSSSPLLKPSFYGRCFSLPCFRHGRVVGSSASSSSSSSSSSIWERLGSSHYDDRWWAPGLRVIKKIHEWSELIAGPKWKTFIRRIRRKGSRNPGGVSAVPGGGKFNYDLADYSLNFDEGTGNFDYDDEFRRMRSFSVGYGRGGAAVAEGGKKGKDAVVFVTA